ncbi:DUF3857 domain-containing transglutaminase family protein [Lysobacter sp. N42]|uniref:DUF3857 domain-containing transglutaminase family protein n=1 Tax=Lysobacter sp. N42 TaxID=2545719 RepID=UPI00104B5C5E|nr:DUF3857 domain-containing protein [Lysobacter sp. N42]TCZ87916.1 DUF3857 domain-containing protein [Lysobacter sp. N42]
MFGAGWLALVALAACAQLRAEEFTRGDYRFETGPVPAFAKLESIEATWPAQPPGASDPRWRFWLYDYQVDRRGGAEHEFVDYVFEPRAASLLGEAGRFEIGFLPDSQALTLHHVEVRRDGRWSSRLDPARVSLARREQGFDQDLADGAVTALLLIDDVRVGDVVRISYSIRGANPMLAGQRTTWMRGGFGSPTLETRTRVLYDAGTALELRPWLGAPRPEVRVTPAGVEVEFAAMRLPATVDHGDYPRGYTPRQAVHVGRRQAWADVAAWALPMYPRVTGELPADLEARLAQWRRLPDASAKLRAALRAVQDEVRYFGIEMGENTHRPHAPAETWTRRFGDCKDKAYLLVTLLDRLGVAAAPALVSVEDGARIASYVPAGDVFDHVIVRARVDGRDVWVDPTISQQGGDPASLDLSDLGHALVLEPGTRALAAIPAPPAATTGVEVLERIRAHADGVGADLEITTLYRGWAADRARRDIGSERPEDLARRYESYYRKRYGEVASVRLPERIDGREEGTFKVVEAYRLPRAFEKAGGDGRIDLHAEALDEPTALPSAVDHPGPLRVPYLGRYVHVTEVTVPDDWSPHFAAERMSHSSKAFRFERTLEIDGSLARMRHEYEAGRRELDPADAGAHIQALRATRDALGTRLSYARPASIGRSERETRLKSLLRDVLEEKSP